MCLATSVIFETEFNNLLGSKDWSHFLHISKKKAKHSIFNFPFSSPFLKKLEFHEFSRNSLYPKRHCFLSKNDNLGVLKSTVWHVYVGGCAGVGACPAVVGRKSGRIRRRPARGASFQIWWSSFGDPALVIQLWWSRFYYPLRISSTQTFRVAGLWILCTQTFGGRRPPRG